MVGSPPMRDKGRHLTDVDIGKILGLVKALLSQRKIASLMKCSQKAVRHTVSTYLFETFQGRNPHQEHKHKTIQREDRYIEPALKQNSFPSTISPTSWGYQFPNVRFDVNGLKWVLVAILPLRNQDYGRRILS